MVGTNFLTSGALVVELLRRNALDAYSVWYAVWLREKCLQSMNCLTSPLIILLQVASASCPQFLSFCSLNVLWLGHICCFIRSPQPDAV